MSGPPGCQEPDGEPRRPATAVCFVADGGYLWPTIAAALSCRRHVEPAVDVIVLAVAVPGGTVKELAAHLADRKIAILDLPPVWRGRYALSAVRGDPSKDAMLGRFFIADRLGDRYERILYLDGDTLIQQSLTPLLVQPLAEGTILACVDSIAFTRHHRSRLGADTRRYFASLSQPDDLAYYNSGVMLADRATWRVLKHEAFDFFVRHTALCHHHDQTAINMACRARLRPLSIRWNYQSNYVYWNLGARRDIAVHHFAGTVKPWTEAAWPFLALTRHYADYRALVAPLLSQARPPRLDLRKSVRHLGKCLHLRSLRRSELRQTERDILAYEATAIL